jgi:hypothetical protein
MFLGLKTVIHHAPDLAKAMNQEIPISREVTRLQRSRSTHQPHGEHDDTAQQSEHAVDGNANEPKRNQEDPHERVDDQRQ